MFCTKCGKQIPDDAKFCTFCGFNLNQNNDIEIAPAENDLPEIPVQPQVPTTPPADAQPQAQLYETPAQPQASQTIVQPPAEPKKKMSKTKVVLGVLAVGVIAALAVAIGSFAQTSDMRKALKNNDAGAIYNEYHYAVGDEKLIAKYEDLISQKIAEIISDVNSWDFSEDAKVQGVGAFTDYLNSVYGDLLYGDYYQLDDTVYGTCKTDYIVLEELIESKKNYYAGIYSVENADDLLDYQDAIESFSSVSQEDSNYDTAMEKITECSQSYMDLTMGNVEEYIKNDDISSAIELLTQAKEYFDSVGLDSSELQEKMDSTLSEYAKKYADKAAAAFKEQDVDTAIGNINVAIELQPENAEYKAQRDKYELYMPFELYLEDNMIDQTPGEGTLYYEESVVGNDGGKYDDVIQVNSYVSKDFWNNTASDLAYTCEYVLGGKYNYVSGTIFLSEDNYHQEFVTYFEAYGDGKLIYTSPTVVAGDLAEDISFDVTDVQRLEIRYYAEISQYNYTSADIYVSNLVAQKAFPESE